jgi:hypothetical protein
VVRRRPCQALNGWTVCRFHGARGGQALAYVYFEDEPGRRSVAKPPGLALALVVEPHDVTRKLLLLLGKGIIIIGHT